MDLAFDAFAAREEHEGELGRRPQKIGIAPHDAPEHILDRQSALVAAPAALVKKDERIQMIGHLLERLHGAELGQVQIALLQSGVALVDEGIERARIDALRLPRPALLEGLLRRRIASRWSILISQADGSFVRLFGLTLAKAATAFNARPIPQKKTAGTKCTRRLPVFVSAAIS
jgi:hypothetical protein